jgi:hypothetical protein
MQHAAQLTHQTSRCTVCFLQVRSRFAAGGGSSAEDFRPSLACLQQLRSRKPVVIKQLHSMHHS